MGVRDFLLDYQYDPSRNYGSEYGKLFGADKGGQYFYGGPNRNWRHALDDRNQRGGFGFYELSASNMERDQFAKMAERNNILQSMLNEGYTMDQLNAHMAGERNVLQEGPASRNTPAGMMNTGGPFMAQLPFGFNPAYAPQPINPETLASILPDDAGFFNQVAGGLPPNLSGPLALPTEEPAVGDSEIGGEQTTGGEVGTGINNSVQAGNVGIGTLDPGAYVPSVVQQNQSMDPIIQQLLFGLGDQPGFIQGAMQAAQNAFYNPDGTPIVYQQPVAGLSPSQLAAINLAQQNVGAIQPYLNAAQSAYAGSGAALNQALQQQVAALQGGYQDAFGTLSQGLGAQIGSQQDALAAIQAAAEEAATNRALGLESLLGGVDRANLLATQATDDLRADLGEIGDFRGRLFDEFGRDITAFQDIGRAAAGRFGEDLGAIEGLAEQAEQALGRRVGEATGTLSRARDRFGSELDRSLGIEGRAVGDLGADLERALAEERAGVGQFGRDLTGSLAERRAALAGIAPGLDVATGQLRSAIGALDRGLAGSELTTAGATAGLGGRLGESEARLRQTTGAFDPAMTQAFYDPFEQSVVQQTIEDVLEAGDQADIAQRARDIQTGGESAFGSRARLTAAERREALGRGLAESLAGIRSQGFGRAQQTALGEFARQQEAQRQAATGLASLAGQRFGAEEALASRLGSGATTRFGAGRDLSQQLGQQAQLESAAGERMAGALSDAAAQRLGATQALARQRGSLASQRFGAEQGLGRQTAAVGAQRFGAGQALTAQQMAAAQAQNAAAQQRISTLGQTAAQRLASQNQLAQQQLTAGQQMLGAGTNLANAQQQQAGQIYGAGTNLAQTALGLGQAASQGLNQAGIQGLNAAGQVAQGFGNLGAAQANLANTLGGAQMGLATNLSNAYGGFGANAAQAAQAQAQGLASLGQTAQTAGIQNVNMLSSLGALQQQNQQQMLNAQYQAQLQGQQAPLAQYQSLLPFMQFAGQQTGPSQINTQFSPAPSPLQAGLGTGLAAFGALGNYFGGYGQPQSGGYGNYGYGQSMPVPVPVPQTVPQTTTPTNPQPPPPMFGGPGFGF